MSARNLTLYIPAEVAKKMDKLQEVNWSKIARNAIETYIKDRLDASIPSEALIRLREEKGKEFANGKKLAVEQIIPTIKYKKLALFFQRVRENAINGRDSEASISGIPEEMLSLDLEGAALNIIKKYFGEIPKDATEQFVKGVLSVLEETWKKLEK